MWMEIIDKYKEKYYNWKPDISIQKKWNELFIESSTLNGFRFTMTNMNQLEDKWLLSGREIFHHKTCLFFLGWSHQASLSNVFLV